MGYLKRKIEVFKERNQGIIAGTLAGFISGIFFAAYSDLKPQFDNGIILMGVSLFVTVIWYFIIMGVYFLLFLIFGKE